MKVRTLALIVFLTLFATCILAPGIFAEESYLEFESLKFFEAAGDPPPVQQRVLATAFPQSTTRSIYYQAGAKNLLYNVKDQNPRIAAKYYYPDGKLMCDLERNQFVPSTWDMMDLWHGWGWDDAGHWPKGAYKVELFFGYKKVGEGSFAIY